MTKEVAVASMILALLFAPLSMAAFAAEQKRVCVMELDNKTKKEREVCKTIKIHKKLEGTKIEDAKKDEKKK
jgi:hypothetical protein